MVTSIDNKDFDNIEFGRKVEFDKGIPLSMDYQDNSIRSVDKKILPTIMKTIFNIFSRQTYLFIFILYIFYVISLLANYNKVNSLEM